MQQFYYKMRQLLQIATILYKIRQLLQNATVITNCNSTQSFYNKYFLNRNGLSDDKVVSFTKNEYGSLV